MTNWSSELVILTGPERQAMLILSAGSVTNDHGVKGLEHCHFLKDIRDAQSIKNTVIGNLERACLPTTSDGERRRLLSFVVSGGGPTGIEFAAELFDMLNEDLCKYYPRLLRNEISVHVVQSRSHILNTYDEALSKYAEVSRPVMLARVRLTLATGPLCP